LVGLISFLAKNALKILVVLLIVAVVIPSVMLYLVYRDYYYERNMNRYAMGTAYTNVETVFRALAYDIRTNVSTLDQTIMTNAHVQDSFDLLEYVDPPNHRLWFRLSSVYGDLQRLAQYDFFPNDSGVIGVKPEALYPYILGLNDKNTEAEISYQHTASQSGYIYNADGNLFQLNQTRLLEMDNIAQQFLSMLYIP
jgi:hypothetical protein